MTSAEICAKMRYLSVSNYQLGSDGSLGDHQSTGAPHRPIFSIIISLNLQ